ncbi:MAG: hypothetical protein JW993_13085 [Sedimentisphaerales bacterium]|nr:hypothetical protein [Sedimentisphaerales bacterium]
MIEPVAAVTDFDGIVSAELTLDPMPGLNQVHATASGLSADFSVTGLTPGYGGGTGTADDPYHIWTAEQMNVIGAEPNEWDKHFRLMADIDVSMFDGREGRCLFNVIGTQAVPFGGVLAGEGHTISHLTITGGGSLGLFGYVGSGAEITGLGIVDVNAIGAGSVGGLAGQNRGTVARCYATGVVRGGSSVGGLVGENNGDVDHCCSTADVSGGSRVGGLVGYSEGGTIANCYSTGAVSGNSDVGGLVGYNVGPVTRSYSTAAVSGTQWSVGGLAGYSADLVEQCYSRGAVTGASYVGGLVGENAGTITECYSTGAVNGDGLVGYAHSWSEVVASFWDTQTSGQATSSGGTGKTTAQMQTAGTFLDAGWNFVDEIANGTEDVWWIEEGTDYPGFLWERHGDNESQCDDYADLGNPLDEIGHNLIGCDAVGSWGTSPSGDTTARCQRLGADNMLEVCVAQTGIDYLLTAEVVDGTCDDSFQIYVNGSGPLYSYVSNQNDGITIETHQVVMPSSYITGLRVQINFKNMSNDISCGSATMPYGRAPTYNVWLLPYPL